MQLKLNKSTKEISDGNFDIDVFIGSNDEISELGESFNIMKYKIKDQIEAIEKDRDDLIKLEGHRKVFFDNVIHEMKTPLTFAGGEKIEKNNFVLQIRIRLMLLHYK